MLAIRSCMQWMPSWTMGKANLSQLNHFPLTKYLVWVALYLFLINVHLVMSPHTWAWIAPSFAQFLDHVVTIKDVIHAKRVGVAKELFSNGHKVPANLWICGILYFFSQQIPYISAGKDRCYLPPWLGHFFPTGSDSEAPISSKEVFENIITYQKEEWSKHSWYYPCLHCLHSVVSYQ